MNHANKLYFSFLIYIFGITFNWFCITHWHGRRVGGGRAEGLRAPPPPPGVLIYYLKLLICAIDPPSNLQIVHVHSMQRNDYYFVQNKICQQPISTAAEPSKQSEVLYRCL